MTFSNHLVVNKQETCVHVAFAQQLNYQLPKESLNGS